MTTPDEIANDHGCDLHTKSDGSLLLTVQDRWRAGDPQDDRRIASARVAIERAGHRVRWYRFDPATPAPAIASVPMPGRVRAPWER